MTCFWDSILSSLDNDDFKNIGYNNKPIREDFIKNIKTKNKLVSTLWQGTELTGQEKKEHFEAIKEYDIKKIYNGHLTSTCDSFLLLISDILHINIEHHYISNFISYSVNDKKPLKTLKFKSNRGHFSTF